MTNSDTTARREKLMMLGFANLIATGFMHAAPSSFMQALPPFASVEKKIAFTLPEDLRVAYESLKSKDAQEESADNHHIFSLAGYIAHNIFKSHAETNKVISVLASLFNDLSDDIPLPNVDGVKNIKDWMKAASLKLPMISNNNQIKNEILNTCQSTGLFVTNKKHKMFRRLDQNSNTSGLEQILKNARKELGYVRHNKQQPDCAIHS